jgi:hypothetical protein
MEISIPPMRPLLLPLLSLALLLTSQEVGAECRIQGGFPVYQCGDGAYFAPPPRGSGAVQAVFWQIGYGNEILNNGEGGSGTGVAPAGVFSGNDSGLWRPPLIPAAPVLTGAGPAEGGIPEGALCLGPVNWGSVGVDGCCDNSRRPGNDGFQDGLLNPGFDVTAWRNGEEIRPTLVSMRDAPMAVLLREETGRFFAAAAVAVAARSGERPDVRAGHYTFADVIDGEPNPLTGARNVIPWQETPRIHLEHSGGGPGDWTFSARWEPVLLHSDRSRRPSEAFRIEEFGEGVGVADMGPLVSYTVEAARLLPQQMDPEGLPRRNLLLWGRIAGTDGTAAEISLEEDTCVRVVVHLGRTPSARQARGGLCARGHCGDIGYDVPGPAVCVEGPLLAAVPSIGPS